MKNHWLQLAQERLIVWGQKKLERKPTALDRVGCRRMLFYIKNRINKVLEKQLFDNTAAYEKPKTADITEQVFCEIVDIFEDIIRLKGGIGYSVTQEVDNRIKIKFQPTKVADHIYLNFKIID